MWKQVEANMRGYPERLLVARTLIENGLHVRAGKIYCNEIEVPPIRVGRVVGVDRRTVAETVKMIEANEGLRIIFQHLRSAGHSLKELARYLDMGVV
jgi:predicted regulator of amino acid metabolism with ACT domain